MIKSSQSSLGVSSALVRAVNLAAVLQHVMGHPGMSRADVAVAMGVTRSTVSRLVDDLVAGGFLAEGTPVAGARGRPATPLSPAAGTFVGVGCELNVDRAACMMVDLTGEVIAERIIDIDAVKLGPQGSLGRLAELRRELKAELPTSMQVLGVHLAVPALVDSVERKVLRAPNLGWENVQLDDMGVSNDIDCAALSLLESTRMGVGKSTFIYVSGEVGIGAAVCIDGELRGGRHGWANELGHVTVDPAGPCCGCGARGCLEAYAGQRTMLATAGVASVGALVEALEAGDEAATGTVRTVGWALGIALSSAMNLLDVSRILLGGHLAVLHPWLRPVIEDEVGQRVLWAPLTEVQIAPVDESPRRTAYGAAWAEIKEAVSDPARWLVQSA